MIKLGILDFDTSHAVEFTKRINHSQTIDKEQWVDGAQVVVGCPGESKLSPERIAGFTKTMKELGVPLVEKPSDMIGKVDAMLIEAVDGSVHLDRARPFLEAGIPCWVDKPFACSLADARKMVELAEKKKLPIFSSSSLRYAPEVVEFLTTTPKADILGVVAYGPASEHERNPGLFHYGIHAVEMLYTLMGPGCNRVTCTHEKEVDVATGQWNDGRVATVRGTRSGAGGYGAVIFDKKKVSTLKIDTKFIYRELLKRVIEMFATGKAPLDIHETLEIVAFIEGAWKSAMNHGSGEKVAV
jgi:hypothetical protein